MRNDRLRSERPVAQRAVRLDLVVLPTQPLDQHTILGFHIGQAKYYPNWMGPGRSNDGPSRTISSNTLSSI